MTRILIVEDTEELRDNITDALQLEGFEVISAPDGPSGIQMARESLPDLILCDIMMPGMDGFAVLQSLKSEDGDLQVPFIFITALAERENFREGMDLGADDYLVKPFTIDELLKAIHSRLAKHLSVEARIEHRIRTLEGQLKLRISYLSELIENQKNLIRDLSASHSEMAEQLNEKRAELMQEALHSIEANTAMQAMAKQLSAELKKEGIGEEQRIMLHNLKEKIHGKSLLLNSLTAFQLKFNQTYPAFTSRLFAACPTLTQQDIMMMAAIFINLNTVQLAGLLGISPESVRKSRYRLKRKLGIDKDKDLSKYIHSLYQSEQMSGD